ncbi:MAG: hypothetical protein ISS55_07380 [Dehalococcoidales bacterium]|nr:hypothetical protein [Dehalococcoidales bacterium]
MRRPKILWVALGLFSIFFCTFLGFWLWAEFGFERTIVMYETARAPAVQSVVPGVTAAEEAVAEEAIPAPVPETPPWLLSVRWSMMAAAAVVAVYIIYLEVLYRRKQKGQVSRMQD